MGGTSVATGSGIGYYESHALEGLDAARSRGYYSKAVTAGEPRAELLGRGLGGLGLSVGAELDDETATAVWEHLCHPGTGEQLGQSLATYAGPAMRLSKAATRAGIALPEPLRLALDSGVAVSPAAVLTALSEAVTPEELRTIQTAADNSARQSVAFYDTLYTQDKSVSVAHAVVDAAGDDRAGEVFEDAMRRASEAIVSFVDDTMYCRVGDHGKSVEGRSSGRYAKAYGVSAAAYRHHTSREGDMHDHVHVLILNRAKTDQGDKYRALDGTMLYNAMSATTALASRASEMHITAELGWRWSKKDDGSRYLAAVDPALVKKFSKRASAIEERLNEWADRFERSNGRAPTPKERDRQHTNIQRRTRAAKPDVMEARVDAVEQWDQETGQSFSDAYQALNHDAQKWAEERQAPDYVDDVIDQQVIIDQALEALTTSRAKFTRWHLLGEIDRAMPANLPEHVTFAAYRQLTMGLVDQAVVRLGVEALTPVGVIDRNVPAEFVTPEGRSVFSPPEAEVYATVEALAAEAYLLARAQDHGAPAVESGIARDAAAAAGLSGDQETALVAALSSGRSLELLVGPAGTGKSYVTAKIASAWRAEHGAPVIGLAKSNAAAGVLASEGLSAAWNCDRWLAAQTRLAAGRGRPRDRALALAPGSLVVVDEASMAETDTLVRIVERVEAVGGKVLLTGDHRQLASVGAGGFFELAAEDVELRRLGAVTELRQVRRFADDWEASASLRLRSGDASVLDVYERHGRIIEAPDNDALAIACDQWVSDYLEGKEALVVVASAEEASAASMKIRRELIDVGYVSDGPAATLGNGALASVGDVVQARANAYKVTDWTGTPLSNRDLLRVVEVQATGGLLTRRVDNGRLVRLSPDYVRNHVELSYALTAHGAQGRTVDTCYAVASPAMDSAALYVALTRAREKNVAVVNTGPADDHDLSPGPASPRATEDVLGEILRRSGGERSAVAEQRAQLDASQSLARLGSAWTAAIARQHEYEERDGVAAVLGAGRMARLDADPAAPAFWAQVAATKRDGIDHLDALKSTLAGREVDSATDLVPLLVWRLSGQRHMAWEPARRPGVTADVDAVAGETYLERSPAPESLAPASLRTNTLDAYARQLAAAMDERVAELGRRAALQAPEWATRHLGAVPLPGTSAREEWEAKAGRVAGYREQYVTTVHINVDDPVGPAPSGLHSPERRTDWLLATRALGLEVRRIDDVSKCPDAELRRAVERWEHTASQAPAYVRHELSEVRRNARQMRSRLVRLEAISRPDSEASRKRLDAERAKVDEAEAYVETLNRMHNKRAQWFEESAVVRSTAREAAAELECRYPGADMAAELEQVPEELSEQRLRLYEQQLRMRDRPDEVTRTPTIGLTL